MSRIDLCRCCGQPLPPQQRAGRYLPARKAAIFDTIHNHPGITAEGIIANCFADDGKTSVKTIHVHVCQINEVLAGSGIKIKGDYVNGKSDHGGYRILRKEVPA